MSNFKDVNPSYLIRANHIYATLYNGLWQPNSFRMSVCPISKANEIRVVMIEDKKQRAEVLKSYVPKEFLKAVGQANADTKRAIEYDGLIPNLEAYKTTLYGLLNRKQVNGSKRSENTNTKCLFDYIELMLKNEDRLSGKRTKDATISLKRSYLKKLKEWQPTLLFNDVTPYNITSEDNDKSLVMWWREVDFKLRKGRGIVLGKDSQATLGHMIQFVKDYSNRAYEADIHSNSKFQKLKATKFKTKFREKNLSEEEYNLIMSAEADIDNEPIIDLFRILLLTGFRISDGLLLKDSDVKNGVIRLTTKKNKLQMEQDGKALTAMAIVTPELNAIFDKYRNHNKRYIKKYNGELIISPLSIWGNHLNTGKNASKTLRRALKAIGISKDRANEITPHFARHYFIKNTEIDPLELHYFTGHAKTIPSTYTFMKDRRTEEQDAVLKKYL